MARPKKEHSIEEEIRKQEEAVEKSGKSYEEIMAFLQEKVEETE